MVCGAETGMNKNVGDDTKKKETERDEGKGERERASHKETHRERRRGERYKTREACVR